MNNTFKIYKVLENNIKVNQENGYVTNELDYTKSLLSSIPSKVGNLYICLDTLNLYVDSNLGRIPLNYTYLKTELDRLRLDEIPLGYYYVNETNILYTYNGQWKIYAENDNKNYPGQFTDINNNSYNVFSDSFKVLVNKETNSKGSLIINPETTINVENNDQIEQVIKSHDYGKMIFNGDYYTFKDGYVRLVTDDGCIDDLKFGDPPIQE